MALHPELKANRGIIAASALGLTVGMLPTLFYSMGTLIPAWEREFGWTRADMSLSLTLATLAMFIFGTIAGKLGDRYGAAKVGSLSLFIYGILLAGLPLVLTEIWQLWFGYIILAIAGVPSSAIIMIRPITSTFDARRGIAMGIAMTGAGVAGFWVPQLVAYLIQVNGWRMAMAALGGLACLASPLVWLGFHEGRKADGCHATREYGPDLRTALRMLCK